VPYYWPTWLGLALFRLSIYVPRTWVDKTAAALGRLYFHNNKKRRDIALINLKMAFPEKTESERRALAINHFEAAVKSILDLPILWWASDRYLKKYVSISGTEFYRQALKEGRNVVLLTGHFVGLDFGGTIISREFPHIGLIKPVKNKLVDWIMVRGRKRFGATLFLRDQGMRPVVKAIRSGYGFYYLPDEDHGPEKSVFVDFFATRAAMLTGAAKLIRNCNATALPAFIKRLDDGQGYELIIKPPLTDFPSGDAQADAQAVASSLEQSIREAPEQYMWTFRIFQTRPNNEKSPYYRPRDERRAKLALSQQEKR
jgi:lauroyl/myristoyl acyltransferase